MHSDRATIIVAGGTGTRMGALVPKQFLTLNNVPILIHTLNAFHNFDSNMILIVVMHEESISEWTKIAKMHSAPKHEIVKGGKERFFSVKNGLKLIPDNINQVAIHDAVRPLVSIDTLNNCFSALEHHSAVVPVIAVNDSLRKISDLKNQSVDRTLFKRVQTPQCFWNNTIQEAYNTPYKEIFTDDASVVEANNIEIHLVNGNLENIKITTPIDILVGEALLKKERK